MRIAVVSIACIAAAILLGSCANTSHHTSAHQASAANSIKGSREYARDAAMLIRIFKEEGVLEVWRARSDGRFVLADTYDICKWSGKLGPKYLEGDRQAPEGFYSVTPGRMNPNSDYHLSFDIGFPNIFDRANGRTGSHLMVHGACSSAGCYSMNDDQIEDIFAHAKAAFAGGQKAIQVQAFPFRMTAENMARYRSDENFEFWTMLKVGYDHFEITRMPPKVEVCERRYLFNRSGADRLNPNGTCPEAKWPEELQSAYEDHVARFNTAFSLMRIGLDQPSDTIKGFEEAAVVAEWSRRRDKGLQVPARPPSLEEVDKAYLDKAIAAAKQSPVRHVAKTTSVPAKPSVRAKSARRRF